MTLIRCPQCHKDYEEEDLFCPHCGTASIPQMSKGQLRLEFMKASKGPLAWIYLGFVVGLVAGGIHFAIRVVNDTADFASGLGVPMGGVIGSSVGFLLHYAFRRDRR
jgi:hypothetical protein